MDHSLTVSTQTKRTSNVIQVLVLSLGVILVFAAGAGLLWAHSTQIQTQRTLLTHTNALGPRVLVMRVQERTGTDSSTADPYSSGHPRLRRDFDLR